MLALRTGGAPVVSAPACAAQSDWSGRREADRAALGLWAGPVALEGVRDDLVLVERARLGDLRRALLDDLAVSLLDDPGGDPDEAHDLALELMAGDPLDEGAGFRVSGSVRAWSRP